MTPRKALGVGVLGLVVGLGLFAASLAPNDAAAERASVKASEPVAPAAVQRPPRAAGKQLAAKSARHAQTGPSEVFFASWGGAVDQLGRERPQEGNPVGPMSFDVDGKGRLHVLDGVNGRVVRRDANGRAIDSVAIDVRDPNDIAVADDGSMAVLDRFADKAVAVYDESGKLRNKLPLTGDLLDDPGSVTGVFVDGSDVYAELEHARLVKIGSMDGAPAEPRLEIPGRPTRDGLSFVHAAIVDAAAGRAFVASNARPGGEHRFTRELVLGDRISSIVLLDTDQSGTIYFAANTVDANQHEVVVLSCLDPQSGAPTGSALMPANTLPEESMRDYVVLDGGGVIQALRTESGVSYARYDCQ